MPFDLKGWSPAGANSKSGAAPGMFTYKTTDALAVVDAANYFLPVKEQLKPGDLIWGVVVDANGAMTAGGWMAVNESTATSVDVTNFTNFVVTDGR